MVPEMNCVNEKLFKRCAGSIRKVCNSIFLANGILNLRYPTRFDKQWRFGKRQDFLTQSRLFMWKPPLSLPQKYSNVKTPLNFNRFGMPSPPLMAPIHQNYMFAVPTKVHYPSYQTIKEVDEKRKPGNLHHITIINAIMPKPYMPTAPTHSHPTSTFRNYRTNNKQLYHQYFNNNFGRQNFENLNKMKNAQQLQLQQHHQPHQQPFQVVYSSSPLVLHMNTPTMDYINVINSNKNNNNEIKGNELNSPVSQCGRRAKDNAINAASDVLYYYCNNRITNYKNPTHEQFVSIQPSTTLTSTTTTTTEAPTTTTTTKYLRTNFDIFTTEKPIFLPTPNPPLENSFMPITSNAILKNSLTDLKSDINIKMHRQNYRPKKYEDRRQTGPRYEEIKRQQQYTTTATLDNMKLHSFFTIEDAVTRAPVMQVFNDPYQAYRHARRHHDGHQRQTITTTTKRPDITAITTKPKFKSFFDDLDEEDYIMPEVPQYDYSFFGNPQKSIYHKSQFRNEQQYSKHNQIIDHTLKATDDNSFSSVDESPLGKPNIKEHISGIFKTITHTTYSPPVITTYKPIESLKELVFTTSKILSFNSKPIPDSTPTGTVLGDQKAITKKENTKVFFNEVHTSTTLPITTTTEKKLSKITFKSPLNLRSSTTFKFPKQLRKHKSYKNLTSTTTKATPTIKKVPKYQRQYKTKKLKQFKHLYTSSSSTTSTTTAIPTTVETHTKKMSVRLLPTTLSAEEHTTRKELLSRSSSTTGSPKKKKLRQQSFLTTEATKGKKIKSRFSTPSSITTNDNTSAKVPSPRRGTKRAYNSKSEKETSQHTVRKNEGKNRRRITSSPATAKVLTTRTSSGLAITSTAPFTPTSTSLRKSSATTTMKSIMKIANSKSRTKFNNGIKSPKRVSNEAGDDRQEFDGQMSIQAIPSTMASIPPLPIEIYFKKSHSAKT